MSAIEFLKLLAEKHLVADRVVAKLRRQIEQSPKSVSAQSIAKLLVKKGQLTSDQAKRLLATPLTPPPLPRVDDELGLAPEKGEELVEAELVDIEEDGLEPVELVAPLDDDMPPSAAPPSHDAWDHEGLGADLDHAEHADESLKDVADAASAGRKIVTQRRGLAGLWGAMRPGQTRRKFTANRWDSPLLLVGGGALLVMLAIGLGLYFYLLRGTGDEAFNAANENYRQQSYGQAISQFQQFVSEYPDHPKVSSAKVHIGMAEIWSHVERRRWQDALDAVRRDLPSIGQEEAFAEARPELASLLPEIMEGFADQALSAEDIPTCEQYLARANDTLEEVNNSAYLPTSVRKGQQPRIEQIEAKLESAKRRINRDRELEKTVAEIRAVAAERQVAKAYELRKSLLKAYPSLENDARLDAVVLEVTEVERAAVEPLSNVPQPLSDEPPSASQFRIALAQRRGNRAADLAGQAIFVSAQGAVYGLRAEDGGVLWRRYVGFASEIAPLDLSEVGANDVVLVDQQRQELVRLNGQTGKLVWRLPCPGQPTAPRLEAGRLWLACRDGERGHVLSVDPANGRVAGGATLPVPVSVSPTVDLDNQRIIQPSAHSSVYVFSAQDWTCLGVTYLGHALDTVVVSPLQMGGAILVAENPGIDFCLLHILTYDTEQPGRLRPIAEPLRLDGQVIVPPQTLGRRLVLTTDRGKIQALELDVNQTQTPLRVAAETVGTVPMGSASYFLLDEGRLWVADAQFTRYELQTSRGQLVRKWLNSKGDRFVAPLRLRGSTLFHVRQRQGKLGDTVAAVHVGDERPGLREGEVIWEVDLGVPPAGEPLINRAAQEINVVSGNGALFAVGKDAIRAGIVDTAQQEIFDPQMPPLVAGVVLTDQRTAYCPAAGADRLVVFDSGGSEPSLRAVTLALAGQLAGAVPVAFQQQLVVPVAAGAVYLLDPATGKPSMAPFQPAMAAGTAVLWQRPTVADSGDLLLVSDSHGHVYELNVQADPQPHLAVVQQQQLDAPPVAPPVVLGSSVLAVVRGGQQDILRQLGLADLQLQEQVDLPGRVIWGPQVVGQSALLMTDQLQLLAVDATQPALAVEALAAGAITAPVVGRAVAHENGIVLATLDGFVWYLDPQSGKVLAKVEVGEALGAGPVLFSGNRFIVCGGDGTLHIVALAAE